MESRPTGMILAYALALLAALDPPKALDPNLKITLFAESPQIVTPTGLTVDAKGRVLGIESHTHFRPEGYTGPPADRIRRFEDTDGDGRADRITTVFEGTKFTMSLAFGPDGRLYVATRNEVFALELDADGIAKAPRTTLMKLDTPGNYPHNGLSGVTFDFDGSLYFGLGENLGAEYKLIGSDGTTLKGGGEGGNIYSCRPDGTSLRRVATGFWNPFAMTFDAFGRLFAVDNDPDSRPPCRLLHIVDDGDYGYRFRNGRKGLHPFTSWNGELPGTLPMVAGTGEAPSGIVAYESDQLTGYRGDLLVTSWGDHRIDRFRIARGGTNRTLRAESSPLLTGGEEFRPVGIAIAPDGSLFVSDWVDKSYDLHGKGRIWHIEDRRAARREDASLGIRHPDRSIREAAAHRMLSERAEGALRSLAAEPKQDERVRATALRALRSIGLPTPETRAAVDASRPSGFREAGDRESPHEPVAGRLPFGAEGFPDLDADPFLAQSLRRSLALHTTIDERCDLFRAARTDAERLQVLLSLRESGDPRAGRILPDALGRSDPRIRLAAVIWIGEAGLKLYRQRLMDSLGEGALTPAMFEATIAAIDRLDGGKSAANDDSGVETLIAKLATDPKSPPPVRRRALRVLRPDHPAITRRFLDECLGAGDPDLRIEAVRTLRDSTLGDRADLLLAIAKDAGMPSAARAEAIAGLAGRTDAERKALLALASCPDVILREQAARSLRGLTLSPEEAERWKAAVTERPELAAILDPPPPATGSMGSWYHRVLRLGYPGFVGDPAKGELVFRHPKGPGCATCHRVDGRGGRIGPDLTATGPSTHIDKLFESITDPSREIAPQFTQWQVALHDGTVVQGLLLQEAVNGDQTYGDSEGRTRVVKAADVAARRPLPTSVMPEGLHRKMTLEEFRDVIAYLRREPDNTLTPEEKADGRELLFDGKTLDGWMTSSKTPSKVPVRDGAINPHGCGGYMMIYDKPLGDFVLSLDFKITPGCNSGVFVRTSPLEPRPGKDVGFNGIEIAIDDTKGVGYHDTGAIYDLVKPTRNAMKPVGDWNHIEITCDGPKIAVVLNGEAVTTMDLDRWTEKNKRPDGSAHKFDIAYKDHPRSGYIGLQDHGGDCFYKNIKVRRLR